GQKVLGPFHESQQRYALNTLGRKGVEVHLGAVVAKVSPDRVDFKDGSSLPTRTVVWAAGVSGPDAARDLGLEVGPGGRIPVGETLQVRSHPDIFAVGDMSWFEGPGGALPMLAPVAMDQGRAAAKNALRLLEGRKLKPFRYRSKGIMATVGRSAAVASLGRLRIMGFGAWAVWLFVHLMMLIGFRNRLAVLINWAWDYLFFERSVRLIIPARSKRARAEKSPEGMSPEEGKVER
ncbi:MAG: NAD(P)/FAD-dependent oxidoreductase, partial [Acidobacteriota bacterium]